MILLQCAVINWCHTWCIYSKNHVSKPLAKAGFLFIHFKTKDCEVKHSCCISSCAEITAAFTHPLRAWALSSDPPHIKLDCSCPVCMPSCRVGCVALSQDMSHICSRHRWPAGWERLSGELTRMPLYWATDRGPRHTVTSSRSIAWG